ncbi:ABC transporter permease [Alkalibacter rhizosphaerae]|uniref:ABC transporter permease n=1 Tax=Alkalibacter rhizosphaerae TaxID=2815577 RepID=A0A975AIY5_9FIRM|nr:ABC transporter permease [Alkalibacter rhizosphaerae]QSX09025.1 ABC transporter permease [Alkalibacter rhizosphaerae]
MTLLVGSIQLGLLYGVMALGIYITFRILQLPDLTVDGSFSLGMAVAAVITVAGHPVLALIVAVLSGALAGLATGLLQTRLAIHPILSGILVMTGLYTVNLFIMGGRANLSVMGNTTVFTQSKTLVALVVALFLTILLAVFFKTRFGLAIRATGDNEDMVRSSSINADLMKCAGLILGNACVGLAGALIGQYQMFSDVGSGSGMVVIGLASVIIGETIFGKRGVTIGLASAVGGSILYRIIIALALRVDLFPSYALKLISSAIVVIALSGPSLRRGLEQQRVRRSVREHQRRLDSDASTGASK